MRDDGKTGPHGLGRKASDSHRAAISAGLKGKAKSPEAVAKMAESLRGKKASDEARANLSIARKAYWDSPEGQARKAGGLSDETRAKKSAAMKAFYEGKTAEEKAATPGAFKPGQVMSEATKERIGVAKRGVPQSPEHIAARAASQRAFYANTTAEERSANAPWTGKHLSEEHKAKLSAARKGRKFVEPKVITKKCGWEGCENTVNFANSTFCSYSCNSKNNQARNPTLNRSTGPENNKWKDGRRSIPDNAMLTAKTAVNHTCEACGKYSKIIDVHHLIPQRCSDNVVENNRPENLVVLCRSCHHASERSFMYEVSIRACRAEDEFLSLIKGDDPAYRTLEDRFAALLDAAKIKHHK